MAKPKSVARKTALGEVDAEVLAFTVGKDTELDLELAEWDCIGSAAHVTMLSRMPVKPPIFTARQRGRVVAELSGLADRARRREFRIEVADQDVHMAVERVLTRTLGELGRRIHTGRSRNDQVAVDLRLYGKAQLLGMIEEAVALAEALTKWARKNVKVPMVGRTHMQPAMPSSVGLWASAHAESLLDDVALMIGAYELNDQCPLGAAASYGVPLPIDRELTARLLGFSRPVGNVLYANNARGKVESIILFAAAQAMLTLSRLAADLILYSMPEFGYFAFPPEYGTGSSIMPQKNTPDVLELVRAKAAAVAAQAFAVMETLRGLPGGYNRDLQATKEPFMAGIATTRACLRILGRLAARMTADRRALLDGFTPAVFATDRALELVAGGMPFRDAYRRVKESLGELEHSDPVAAALRKRHLGAPGGLDFEGMRLRMGAGREFVREEQRHFRRAVSSLLGAPYPRA